MLFWPLSRFVSEPYMFVWNPHFCGVPNMKWRSTQYVTFLTGGRVKTNSTNHHQYELSPGSRLPCRNRPAVPNFFPFCSATRDVRVFTSCTWWIIMEFMAWWALNRQTRGAQQLNAYAWEVVASPGIDSTGCHSQLYIVGNCSPEVKMGDLCPVHGGWAMQIATEHRRSEFGPPSPISQFTQPNVPPAKIEYISITTRHTGTSSSLNSLIYIH